MKKLLYTCGVFAGGSLLQLISSTAFLFVGMDPMVETGIQALLLLLTAVALILAEIFLNQINREGLLDDADKGLIFQINRLASILLAIETACVIAMAVASIFALPMWAHGALAVLFVAACVISVIVVFRAVRAGMKEDGLDEQPEEDIEEP